MLIRILIFGSINQEERTTAILGDVERNGGAGEAQNARR